MEASVKKDGSLLQLRGLILLLLLLSRHHRTCTINGLHKSREIIVDLSHHLILLQVVGIPGTGYLDELEGSADVLHLERDGRGVRVGVHVHLMKDLGERIAESNAQ